MPITLAVDWTLVLQYGLLALALALGYKGVWMFKGDHETILKLVNDAWEKRFEEQNSQWQERYNLMQEGRDEWRLATHEALLALKQGVDATQEMVRTGSKLMDLQGHFPALGQYENREGR